mmetsp:Transcript_20851/g.30043  ORF Transcript_20851/g.30043 Transcript_20851/m.30043 type:complete len:89 (-) Transcript_20851:243-509(-)
MYGEITFVCIGEFGLVFGGNEQLVRLSRLRGLVKKESIFKVYDHLFISLSVRCSFFDVAEIFCWIVDYIFHRDNQEKVFQLLKLWINE